MDRNSNIRGFGTASGTNTYVVSVLSVNDTAYVDKGVYIISFTNSNTGASTLDINGIGAKNILDSQHSALTTGLIPNNGTLILVYDSVLDAFICTFPTPTVDTGEDNTASNLGGGAGIFNAKVGVDLQFKSLTAGSNITITPSGTEIEIQAAAGVDTNIYNSDGTISVSRTVSLQNQLIFDQSLSGQVLIKNGTVPATSSLLQIRDETNNILAFFGVGSSDNRGSIEMGHTGGLGTYIYLRENQPGSQINVQLSADGDSFFLNPLGIGVVAPTTDLEIAANTLFTITSSDNIVITDGVGTATFYGGTGSGVGLSFNNPIFEVLIGGESPSTDDWGIVIKDNGGPVRPMRGCLDMGDSTYPMLAPNLTAVQASALTAVNSMLIYVTSTDATFTSVGFWGYENGAWVKL